MVRVYGSDIYCMYMPPKGAAVIELVSEAINHPVFARYGAILGMNHQFIRSSNAEKTMRRVYKKDCNIDVDCDDLDNRLNDVIKRGMKSLNQGK